ncbi:hypothetical protein [Paenibacillus xylanexedens]|uniref:hypothetical protein n=1 Tax=Paenibacillus xylanexedens TaxID=528191 RepID=UPI0011A644CC|nr:hypothetical protein [Paenibacillus xylanexedens]
MFSQPIYIATILLVILAIGELVSIWSKARIPSLLVILIGYLLLNWAGFFPQGVVSSSALSAFGALMVAPLIVHMGTLIPLKLIRSQYKAILISLFGSLIATGLILLIVTPFYGYPTAVAGSSPVVGGIISYLITATKLQEMNLAHLITIPAVILGIHSLVGMPLATNLLRRYALKLQKQGAFENKTPSSSNVNIKEANVKTFLPKRFHTAPILLLFLFIMGSLSIYLGNVTGLSYSIWALLLGVIGHLVGLFPSRILDKASTSGIAMIGLIIVVMTSMESITVDAVVSSIIPVLFIIAVGVVGVMIGGFLGSKLFKWDPLKGLPVALTALFGFPGDYIICEEVSRSVGRDENERQAILDEILTPMLVGGFTTVTTASVLIASVLIKTL